MKKKIIAVVLVTMSLTMSLVGCGANSGRTSDETSTQSGNVEGMVHMESAEEVAALFEDMYKGVPEDQMPMMVETRELDMGDSSTIQYNTGLSDVSQIEGITLSESMVGAVAYSVVYVRTADGADVDAIAKNMMDNIDPAKWICVIAEKQLLASFGNDIFYIMGAKDTVQTVYDQAAKIAKDKNMKVTILSEKTNG